MKNALLILVIMTMHSIMSAQNYDESKIPPFTLPELLVNNSGHRITTVEGWENQRRGEILKIFSDQMYGKVPDFEYEITYDLRPVEAPELAGKATMEEVMISLSNANGKVDLTMLLILPANTQGNVPVFLGLNFRGNQAINTNPNITIAKNYIIGDDRPGYIDHRATEESRGTAASRWPLELILEKGYGLATIHCGDIDPDFDDGFENGVHALLDSRPVADEWGTIAAWAWGLSRAMDYFETDDRIDPNKVAVIGHSRLGKASLWAGANDQRFALVISNDSGCGGAALSRRRIGETVEAINTRFPHWFCRNFHQYNDREDELPIDQHMLIALMAPRPVYVASAQEDQWADPKGEFRSLYLASPVYQLFGLPVLQNQQQPEVDKPVDSGFQGYHVRSGGHDITRYDWDQYIKFADKHFQ